MFENIYMDCYYHWIKDLNNLKNLFFRLANQVKH